MAGHRGGNEIVREKRLTCQRVVVRCESRLAALPRLGRCRVRQSPSWLASRCAAPIAGKAPRGERGARLSAPREPPLIRRGRPLRTGTDVLMFPGDRTLRCLASGSELHSTNNASLSSGDRRNASSISAKSPTTVSEPLPPEGSPKTHSPLRKSRLAPRRVQHRDQTRLLFGNECSVPTTRPSKIYRLPTKCDQIRVPMAFFPAFSNRHNRYSRYKRFVCRRRRPSFGLMLHVQRTDRLFVPLGRTRGI